MKFGLTICNHGDFADPRTLTALAIQAEEVGWDGVFVWDHVARDGEPPMTDPWIALAAIAVSTTRVALGPMVTPLARRRPWKLAREVVALDQLSGGRLILGVGLGGRPEEFDRLGDEPDPKGRAALLDEGLEVLTKLLTAEAVDHAGPNYQVSAHFRPGPVNAPGADRRHGIPIWVGATWPNKPPLRRAARFDGLFPVAATGAIAPEHYPPMSDYIASRRNGESHTLVHQGSGEPGDMQRWPEYAAVGVDWWLESFRSETRGLAEAQRVIAAGPPGQRVQPAG